MAKITKTAAELRDEIAASTASARNFLRSLFDEGTFLEFGTYVKNGENGSFEGVITGCGAVDGRPVYAFVQDKENEKAAFSAAHGKKIASLYDAALKACAPVVGVFSGSGAKVSEGIDCLSSYGSVMAKINEAKGIIPQIAVIEGVCGGASAVICQMFDIIISSDKAGRYVTANGKTVGASDVVCDSSELTARTREILNLLPSSCEEGSVCLDDCETINDPLDVSAYVSDDSDVKELISALSDNEPVILTDGVAPEMVTALSFFNGRAVGFVANQPKEKGGALTASASKKAARFISLCTDFNIPVITLVNTVGFKGDEDDYLSALSSLAYAYANCPVTVTAVIGKAYGSAFTLMGSKALGADFVFALDTAVISVLDPETAVEFLRDKELREASDPASARKTLKDEWISNEASPLNASRSGDVDDVVDSLELKQRMASAVEFLA